MIYEHKGIENDLYLRAQLQHMVKNPSESRMQKLEDTFDDIAIDYTILDHGEEPRHGNYEPIIGECLEEEI